jgi:hypothetical protein
MSTPRGEPKGEAAYQKVREICLRFPEADEKLSHGMPSFHVRGKMFAHFVDNAHGGEKQIAVWCKATFENQKRLVRENPDRFFVPPYVGVKGWLGIDVDPARADFIELTMLVEEAWTSVAPPKLVSGESAPKKIAKKPAAVRVLTDPKIAKAALEKLSKICSSLPQTERDLEASHASFRVRKKVFVYFLDNHHGDGIISACVKGDARENAKWIAKDPKRFYLPAYIGPRGYLGIRLDSRSVDWKDVAARVKKSWEATAPKTLLEK